MYGTYLIGQTSGLSDELSLTAVRSMFAIEETPREERRETHRRMKLIHREYSKLMEALRGSADGR